MKNRVLRSVTVLLAIWMLVTTIPISAFADILNLSAQPISDDIVYVLAEDNTKRSEFEKHYYCSDGTFVAVTYPEAVHYQNEQGEWMDVDMRLTSDNAAQAYESQSGNFKTTFSKPGTRSDASVMSAGSTVATVPAVSIQSGEYSLSWTLTGTKSASETAGTYGLNTTPMGNQIVLSASSDAEVQVNGGLKTAQAAFSVSKIPVTDPDAFALPSASNQVIYENIFGEDQNVSVRYSVSMNKIEEDILITAPTEMTSFSMQVECGTLTPVHNTDNSVDFLDNSGNMVYHVSSPYLVDAAFVVSYDISVTLTEKNGVCTITYTPDAEWMNDSARVYPIMLDPAVTTNDYLSAIMDTYVVQNDPSGYPESQYLYFNPNGSTDRIAVLKIQSFPSIHASMPIISAKLRLVATSTQNSNSQVTLSTVQDGFNVLMDNYSKLLPKMNGSKILATETLEMITEFDITQSISDIYTGAIGNTFAIHCDTSSVSPYIFPFKSMESADTSARPCMTITYGYNLPPNLASGDHITIKNSASGGSLYPNSGLIGQNRLVLHAPDSISDNYKLMTLRQNTANGTYRIEYTPSSNSSGVYISANTTNQKVVMFNTDDEESYIKQDWLIVPCDTNTFKIVLASDMRYVMTAVGSATGYISDESSATSGYIAITLCDDTPLNSQKWEIYKNGSAIENTADYYEVEPGAYYVNNYQNGKFLHKTSSGVNAVSGTVASLEDTIAWRIVDIGNQYYVIQSIEEPNLLLAHTYGASNLYLFDCRSGSLSAQCKWIFIQTTYGIKLVNALTGKTVYSPNVVTSNTTINAASDGSIGQMSYHWKLIPCLRYREVISFSFADITIMKGSHVDAVADLIVESNQGVTNGYSMTSLDKDFVYSSASSDIVSIDQATGEMIARDRGTATITVIHKPTGISDSFDVTVEKKAFIIVPGLGGSVLQMGENFPGFESFIERNNDDLTDNDIDLNVFSGKRLDDIFNALPSIEIALNDIIRGFSTVTEGYDFLDVVSFYTDETTQPEYIDGIEAIALLATLRIDHDSNYNFDLVAKPFNKTESDNLDKYGVWNSYQNLYNALIDITERCPEYEHYEVTMFTYDWRKSCADSAMLLNSFIQENEYDNVILVCHSTGGLVADGYLSLGDSQCDIVEKFISFGVPHWGTPVTPAVCLTGEIWLLKYGVTEDDYTLGYNALSASSREILIQHLVATFPSIYELMPTQEYVMSKGYLKSENNAYTLGYDKTKAVLSGHMKGFRETLMEEAEAFHESLYSLINGGKEHVINKVDHVLVYSESIDTIELIIHDKDILGLINNFQYTVDKIGDSVVPGCSATMASSDAIYKTNKSHYGMINELYEEGEEGVTNELVEILGIEEDN